MVNKKCVFAEKMCIVLLTVRLPLFETIFNLIYIFALSFSYLTLNEFCLSPLYPLLAHPLNFLSLTFSLSHSLFFLSFLYLYLSLPPLHKPLYPSI